MTWRATFDKGVACYKRGDLDGALAHMNQAAELQGDAFIIFDSRAAVHEKLGSLKAALLDSKRVVELAPDRWQGYVRSARLFNLLGKYDSAIKVVDHALGHLRPEDGQRHAQLLELREKAVTTREAKDQASRVTRREYRLGTLPVETLVDIFTVLIDEDHTWAVKLSHVCGHWRRILIDTPSAWQTLILSRKRPVRKVKLWKQRSKNRISCLSVDVSILDKSLVFAELQGLFWDHLSTLRISGEALVELHRMLSDISVSHTFSKLDELSLLDCTYSDQLSCCISGPDWKLRTLRLSGNIHMKEEWWQRIQQLKELHVTGIVHHFSVQVFAANPSLEKFVLVCPGFVASTYENAIPTSMDNLKSIECYSSTDPFPIMRAIVAPSITHFSIFHIPTMADETLLHIASRPSLVKLHIKNCSLSSSTLPILLSSTPNLETLQISSLHAVANEVLQFLTPRTIDSRHGLPCRALQHVDLSHCTDLTTSSVYAFVKNRVQYASESAGSAEKCAIVASLNVDGCPNIEADMLPWFRSKVARFSCVYATRKDFKKDRRRYRQL